MEPIPLLLAEPVVSNVPSIRLSDKRASSAPSTRPTSSVQSATSRDLAPSFVKRDTSIGLYLP
jgi:hypothetical protein